MPRLEVACEDHLDRIYRESHSIWGAGLSFEDYRSFWNELGATPWARKHLTFHVWLGDRGEVLSSFKLYRPRVRFLGRERRACVIGAVFTPRAQRRKGHALDMMRSFLDRAREEGEELAMLFTDIGTRYYEALGFRALPAEEVWGRLPRAPARPDWELVPMQPEDLDAVGRMHDEWCEARPLAMLRDREHWEFLLVRARSFFTRLGRPGMFARFSVARYRGSLAGYLITVHGQAEWGVREVGASGGDASMMAAILEAGAAQARREGVRRLYAWLPREVTRSLPGWKLFRGERPRAIPMLLPLNGEVDLSALESPDAAFLPYQDQF